TQKQFKPLGAPLPDEKQAYRVDLGASPIRGSEKAKVTLVMFGDFEDRYSIHAFPVVLQLASLYGDKLRVVFKNAPGSTHKRAEPAAELALEARAQLKDAGFWKVHDLLFGQNGQLTDADLEAIARAAGLKVKPALAAVAKRAHAAEIEADLELADDLRATSTPTFFVNGR